MSLPAEWKPRHLHDLIRLGNPHDGGYVVPERALARSEALISFGISDDWSFEEDFCRRVPRARVVGYDPTLTRNFWLKRMASHAGAFIFRGEAERAPRVFDWLRYRQFFDGKLHEHRKIRIGYDSDRSASVDTVLRSIGAAHVFMKIDIEGGEYRVLDQIATHANRLTGLVIELHDIDLMRERITRFLRTVQHELVLCHLHANNCAGVDDQGDPLAIELSLVSRALVDADEASDFELLPGTFDAPNDAHSPEIRIRFED